MNEYNESMEKRKRWILSITIGCFLIIFFSQKINAQGMVLEFMDHYYHGIMTGFFPAVSKTEVTFSGNILSDMVCMYYQETVPILQYRTDYKDKKEEDLVQQDYYFQDDETTDEVVEEVKKEEKLFHAKKWENSKYLRKYIYQIDSTTMATENELNGKVLLNTNLKLRKSDEPQILIYHTHGSEAYRGSRKGRKSDTVIGVGDVLTKRLEQKNIKVVHDDDVEKKLANHEIDCFVSLEESIWSEQGISSVTTIGKSGIYFAINKERSDIKTKMDYAMRQLEQDSPFFKSDLYKKYFTLDYKQSLTGKEKSWVEEHGGIKIGFLNNDQAIFSMDQETGKLTGMLAEYISYA